MAIAFVIPALLLLPDIFGVCGSIAMPHLCCYNLGDMFVQLLSRIFSVNEGNGKAGIDVNVT